MAGAAPAAAVRILGRRRARTLARHLVRHLGPGTRVLDLGSGTGQIAEELRRRSLPVTECDIRDVSVGSVRPLLLRPGRPLPFRDGEFDATLLAFVLHHASDPRGLFDEALRVAGRVVVLEDLYVSSCNHRLTTGVDAVLNWQRNRSPGTRRLGEWRAFLERPGWRVRTVQVPRFYPLFHTAVFVLHRTSARR